MTITRILLALVAILLCIYLAFGLPHGTEKDKNNNEHGIGMLELVREFLEGNASQPTNSSQPTSTFQPTLPQALNGSTPTKSSKTRKFYSVAPPSTESESVTQNTKNSNLNIGNNTNSTLSPYSIYTNKNSSEAELDLVLVIDVNDQSEHEDESEDGDDSENKDSVLDVKNSGTKHVDKIMLNHVILSKTIRVSKVEEVFEDLVSQNVRRVIKEDRAERIEISRNKETETIGDEFGIKELLSL